MSSHRTLLTWLTLIPLWLKLLGEVDSIGLTTPTLPISNPETFESLGQRGTDWARAVRISNRLEKRKFADWRARGRAGLTLNEPGPEDPELSSSSEEEEDDEEDDEEAQQEVQRGLWRACRTGNLEGLLLMLEAGADVEEPDPETDKRTPLHLAVIHGAEAPIEALIDAGARLDARADMGRPPLHFAAWPWECAVEGVDVGESNYTTNIKVVDLLLQRGANVNTRDDFGVTALHTAAAAGWTRICEQLIAVGADMNAVNLGSFTPLHLAAQSGRLQACELLLERGAAWEYAPDTADSPLALATMMRHTHVMECLQQFARGGRARGGGKEGGERRRGGQRQDDKDVEMGWERGVQILREKRGLRGEEKDEDEDEEDEEDEEEMKEVAEWDVGRGVGKTSANLKAGRRRGQRAPAASEDEAQRRKRRVRNAPRLIT